jgi:hypothetical protein
MLVPDYSKEIETNTITGEAIIQMIDSIICMIASPFRVRF